MRELLRCTFSPEEQSNYLDTSSHRDREYKHIRENVSNESEDEYKRSASYRQVLLTHHFEVVFFAEFLQLLLRN